MGAAERRAREKQELRRAILDAARDLFAEQGYQAVSMRKIAEKIEYSPTSIYLHFKDKDEILRFLVAEGFSLLCQRMQQVRLANPIERIREGGKCYTQFALENPHYYTLMFQMAEVGALETILEQKDKMGREAFSFIRNCVSDAIAQGYFRGSPPEIIQSHILWSQIHGAVALALAGRLAMLPEEYHPAFWDSMIEVSLHGLLKSTSPTN